MAKVVDRWHLSRPPAGGKPCSEHHAAGRVLVPSADHGRGKRWLVRYRDAAGEQQKESFAKRSDADSRAAKVKAALDTGTFVDRDVQRQDFRTFAEEWRTSATHRPRTEVNVERGLRLHVYPILGDRPTASIKRSEIRAWVKNRKEVLAPVSLRTPWNALLSVMDAAVADGLRTSNPCHGVDLPELRTDEVVPLEPDVVRALISAASPRYQALVRLAATTGLRQAELFGLEAQHVDLDAMELEVEQQLVRVKGAPYLAEPKTDKSYRTVPLSPSAAEALRKHMKAFPLRAVKVEDRTNPRAPHWREAQLLFRSEREEQLRTSSWGNLWGRLVSRTDKALEAAGSTLRVPEGTTLHDLRHFYASVLIKHGASVKKVQRRLGHAKPSITLDLYVHLYEDDGDDTAALMDSVLA